MSSYLRFSRSPTTTAKLVGTAHPAPARRARRFRMNASMNREKTDAHGGAVCDEAGAGSRFQVAGVGAGAASGGGAAGGFVGRPQSVEDALLQRLAGAQAVFGKLNQPLVLPGRGQPREEPR